MKNSKVCPKCGSYEIVRVNGEVGAYGAGNNIRVGAFSAVKLNQYICCSCGFVEAWLDQQDLEKVKKSKRAIKRGQF